VLAYKDGILFDIELKNDRIAPGGKKISAVTQAEKYSEFLLNNLHEYAACLAEFPNFTIGKIREVRGIALVPHSKRPSGKLEESCRKKMIALWTFDKDDKYRIQKDVHLTSGFVGGR